VIGILVSWIVAIFVSFGLSAPRSPAVHASLICALAVGSAIFMILELDCPFNGLLRISSKPGANAIAHILPQGG
jgi:hypothetical protein